jgi:CelD/BcsL family acetyltransferase involved in cellulose biosynthesis
MGTSSTAGIDVDTGGLEIFDRLADEWRDLLEDASDDHPYNRPEWMLAHLRAYFPKAPTIAITMRQSGSLKVLAPLMRECGSFSGLPARKIRLPLSMPGARNEVVMAPEMDQEASLHAVWDTLKSLQDWDVLELPSVYEKTPISRLSQLAGNEGYKTGSWPLPPIPTISLNGCDIAKLPPSSVLRSRLRQAERRLNELGNLSLQCFEKADVVRRFLDLEASGWKGKEKSAILSDARSLQFFDEVAREAEKFKYLKLYYLELNGKLISAHFGMNYRDRYYAPKIAYDEAYREYRVGHLILSKIMRACAQQGIVEYPMGVLEEWKTEWTKESIRRTFQCIFNKNSRGRLLYAARFQIKPRLKKLAQRIGAVPDVRS